MLLLPPLEVPDVLTQGSVFLFLLIPKTISVAIKPQLKGVGRLAQILLQLPPAGHLSPVDLSGMHSPSRAQDLLLPLQLQVFLALFILSPLSMLCPEMMDCMLGRQL